jgi:hypothetical protein
MVLVMARGGLDFVNRGQKSSRECQKITVGSQGVYLKTGIVTA